MPIPLVPPHDPAQPRPWLPIEDDSFDYNTAYAEGWTVSEAALTQPGEPGIQLQRIDCPAQGEPIFPDDRDAWNHVVSRARAGSALHRQALEMIDNVERFLIEATHGAW